jgi:glycosyltransferase involved in cell wall biosynthesis
MRFLFFNHNVAWSGTFFRAFQLGRMLVRQGHQVTVVTTSRSARLQLQRHEREGVELVEAPDLFWGRGRTGWDPWNLLHRTLRLEGGRFDAIHAFDCRPAVILPALYHARTYDLPLFMDWADWWGRGGTIDEREGWLVNRLISGVETWFEEAFRKHALGTTVISSALEQRAISLGVPAQTIHRFPQGCDAENLRPQAREHARERLEVDAQTRVLLHIGQVYPRDCELLLKAVQRLIGRISGLQLVLLGNPRAPIPNDVLPAGSLRRTGFVDYATLQLWLAAADVCVIPLRDSVSARGRWPSKINDYFSAGRAVVMPCVGDAATYVQGASAGWICKPQPDDFADALCAALGSSTVADAAGQRGRALAETQLAWATLADGVDTFYRRAISQSAALPLLPIRTV